MTDPLPSRSADEIGLQHIRRGIPCVLLGVLHTGSASGTNNDPFTHADEGVSGRPIECRRGHGALCP